MNGTEKGVEFMCSIGSRACEYRVGGYWMGSAIYGLDSFPLLAPSHIDYSKVDPGLSNKAYFLQNARNCVHKSIFYY